MQSVKWRSEVSIFDLVFIAVFLATFVSWIAAGVMALGGSGRRALWILRAWAIGFAGYMAAVVAASLPGSRRFLGPGDPLCFDDWCLAVEGADRAETGGRALYRVSLRIFSRARRVSQRERNGAVYLEDGRGRRYAPRQDPAEVPLDSRLDPGQSVFVERVFDLPAGAPASGLVFRHEGGFPIGWFIIGYETWFRPPVLIRLR